jgi:endonuclease G, mitochondrial
MASIEPLFLKAIDRAIERAKGLNLAALVEAARFETPEDLSTAKEKEQRRAFIETQKEGELSKPEIEEVFERIISGNELQDINYLEKGMLAARAVCRIWLKDESGRQGYGTGFLVAPNVLLTNNHVLPDEGWAQRAEAQFRYERDVHGTPLPMAAFALEPDKLFITHEALDFSLVAVRPTSKDRKTALSSFGHLPLIGTAGKAAEGEWLTIVQHPAGEMKQVCVRENQLLKRADDVLWYSTDTLAGSSGSPVFSNDWLVVALHHSGVPEKKNGVIQTTSGQDYVRGQHSENDIKWIANEGIRTSRIVQTLKENYASEKLVKSVLAAKPPAAAAPESATPETTLPAETAPAAAARVEVANIIRAPADSDFSGTHLKGYDPGFLGSGFTVALPLVGRSAPGKPAPLIGKPKSTELKYEHFSVVMNQERRLAYFSACNLSSSGRHMLSGRDDDWVIDPRIARAHQLDETYYTRNKLDRGHLSRREDLEYGRTVKDAVRSANGTCVFTNGVPMRDVFNRGQGGDFGDDARLWQGLERYILEQTALEDNLNLQVFTGPVFSDFDPLYRGFAIPLDFWKVVVGVTGGGQLFATAYQLSQANVIDPDKLDESALPLGSYKTYQRKVAQIEALTGLQFRYFKGRSKTALRLAAVDPLDRKRPPARRSDRPEAREAMSGPSAGELSSFADVVLPGAG